MEIRRSFRVSGQLWRVKRLDSEAMRHLETQFGCPSGQIWHGYCDTTTRTIYLERTGDEQYQFEIYCHEVVHAMLRSAGLDYDDEERVAQCLEKPFASFLKYNYKDKP